jgi:hypothetical protein
MKLKRREAEVFSLSFLDVICCGFGAIILLLVLSEFGQPLVLEKSRADLGGQVLKLQAELNTIRGETDELDRRLKGRLDELDRERLKVARLAGDMSRVRGQFAASKGEASVTNIVESELVSAYQTLTAEMERLLKSAPQRRRDPVAAVGGIPVDSEYVIFVIDTSGSMLADHWDTAIDVMKEILDIYPKVKGIQVLDDEGKTMFSGTRGQWLIDSAPQRARIVSTMRVWRAFSNSSPVEGIVEAIRRWWAPDKRISLYVLGDEFTGDSYQAALDAVARVNRLDARGRRLVRVHSIGFPEGPNAPPFTNARFSALMRAMCDANDGTFVGLTSGTQCAASVEIFGVKRCLR